MSLAIGQCVNHLVNYHHVGEAPVVSSDPNPTMVSYIGSPIPNFGMSNSWSRGARVNVFSDNIDKIRQFSKEEAETERQTTAAVIGGIATIALAGLSAMALKNYQNDSLELSNAWKLLESLDQNTTSEVMALRPILNEHIRILSNKCSRARRIAMLVAALFATAIGAFAGGMMGITWLVTAAIVASVVLASIAMFGMVWYANERTTLPPAMQRQLEQLQKQFSLCSVTA
jgi:hypothetical protein